MQHDLAHAAPAALLTLAAGPAFADGEIDRLMTPADKARLQNYGETRKAALAEARGGEPSDVATLDGIVAKPLVPFQDLDLTGNWQCRTIKAGGHQRACDLWLVQVPRQRRRVRLDA